MPRVVERVKSARGQKRTCGRCGAEIAPGQKYLQWSFRYGGTHYRCGEHRPRRSELTQSKMSAVYSAIEFAEAELPNLTTVEDVRQLVHDVAETVEDVVQEYRDAAEPFGGQGENAERADELEGWQEELESFEPDEADADDVGDDVEAALLREGHRSHDEDWEALRKERVEAAASERESEAADEAREAAQDLLSGCPL